MLGVYLQCNTKLACAVRHIGNIDPQIFIRMRNDIGLCFFGGFHYSIGISPWRGSAVKALADYVAGKAIEGCYALVVSEYYEIIVIPILGRIAFSITGHIALEAYFHIDHALELPFESS